VKLGLIDALLARRWLVALPLAALCGLLVLWSGGGGGLERQLREVRDGIRSHPASGEVHIVEIDSASLRSIAQWPFPRRYHGALVDRLRAAGVRSIGFDVDFSSPSNPVDDAAFAAALARSGGNTFLATLSQHLSSESSEMVDNIPIDPLRDHAFLASVTVQPDADGQVRSMLLGLVTGGVPRPALAAMIAERDAEIGDSFPIDYSIDPATIPRHSYADVIAGRVPAAELRGKRILIGATAVEMGDRYGTPRHGVIPGVVIQALAAETLLAGPPPGFAHPGWALALALLTIFVAMTSRRRLAGIALFGGGTLAVLGLPLAGERYYATTYPVAPALAALAAAAAVAAAFEVVAMLRRRARVDGETGLPNLAALTALPESGRGTIVVARIERFAAIAAGLGPAATVNLIHRIADRLGFGQERPIYRLDEAHLGWVEPDQDVPVLAEKLEGLAALMRSPVDCGRLVDINLAFGVAARDGAGWRQQAANASLAAERAARQGARFEWFAADGDEETDWHLSLLGELDAAMTNGEVWNAYQPKLDLASGRIIGVEALVRWDHPARGKIGPDQFIPLVEANGRARDLTLNVLRRALVDGAAWRAAGLDLSVAVNVSTTLLLDTGFVALLENEIAAAGLPAGRITLEVTESAAMKDSDRAIATLESWRALGVSISIDDYGTGQSSLSYLQTLPATELKIDKSFVANIAADQRNAIMVRSTIALAHELGMKVVAEGIEDADCLASLAAMGCDTAQGYHIGRPMPAADIVALVQEERRAAA
jgi:EAL domain-containing protein (putative c-di-GMP-specific phosphodiesterase class I)/CHASE2 domain-containing sensor protein